MTKSNKRVGHWVYWKVVIVAASFMYGMAPAWGEKGRFEVTVKAGMVTVQAKQAGLSGVLRVVGEKVSPSFSVESLGADRQVNVSFTDLPLQAAIDRLAGSNYAVVYNVKSDRIEKIFLLPVGSGISMAHVDPDSRSAVVMPQPVGDEVGPLNQTTHQGGQPEKVAEYIQERHACLKALARDNSKTEIAAQVSFVDFIPDRKAVEIIEKHRSKVTILRHGWRDESGEFGMDPDDSVEENLKVLHQKTHDFLALRRKSLRELLQKMPSSANPESMTTREKNIRDQQLNVEERWEMLQRNEVPVYGATVKGGAGELEKLIAHLSVRLVDALDCHGPVMGLLNKMGLRSRMMMPLPIKPDFQRR